MILIRLLQIAVVTIVPTTSWAGELRIASWNIANLADAPEQSLRGHVRSEQDYNDIADRIALLGADVIALQEIGSIPGADRVLSAEFKVAFESRCTNNIHKCQADNDDIYTAIAYRKDIAGEISVFQVDSLGIEHTNECGTTRPVRGGVGVRHEVDGNTTWILSVHMKATCKDDRIEPGTEDDCLTQRAQYEALKTWIEEIPEDDTVVLAGDFNRHLLKSTDSIRKEIFDDFSDEALFLPEGRTRSCWKGAKLDYTALKNQALANNPAFEAEGVKPRIFSPISNLAIDFFVVFRPRSLRSIASDQVEVDGYYDFRDPGSTIENCDGSMKVTNPGNMETLTFGKANPSDHCPILMTIGH